MTSQSSLRQLHGLSSGTTGAQLPEHTDPRLRVLLYLPLISHATLAPLAYAALARSVSQILHTYSDLANIKQVRPSWPQVHRLVICGQLLILCHDAGELHVREAEVLFQLLVDLLAHHQPLWPVCLQLLGGFSAAAASFGEL